MNKSQLKDIKNFIKNNKINSSIRAIIIEYDIEKNKTNVYFNEITEYEFTLKCKNEISQPTEINVISKNELLQALDYFSNLQNKYLKNIKKISLVIGTNIDVAILTYDNVEIQNSMQYIQKFWKTKLEYWVE